MKRGRFGEREREGERGERERVEQVHSRPGELQVSASLNKPRWVKI